MSLLKCNYNFLILSYLIIFKERVYVAENKTLLNRVDKLIKEMAALRESNGKAALVQTQLQIAKDEIALLKNSNKANMEQHVASNKRILNEKDKTQKEEIKFLKDVLKGYDDPKKGKVVQLQTTVETLQKEVNNLKASQSIPAEHQKPVQNLKRASKLINRFKMYIS